MDTVEYEGWTDSLRLTNGDAELIVTTAIGPRVVHYAAQGGANAFHVIPETRGQSGAAEWLPYGGHRTWHAPEAAPRSYAPDNVRAAYAKRTDDGVAIGNATEPTTGIRKELALTLAESGSAVRVVHKLTNENIWPITLAPWALSIVANGGRVVIPQEPFASHDDDLLPARPVVLWKFTDMADRRWRWGTRYITLTQDATPDKPQKVGVYNKQGWAAHVTPDHVFVIGLETVTPVESLTDNGSNYETYTDGPFQELETLGPLTLLEPGQTAEHVELWYLENVSPIEDTDDSLDAHLLPVVERAKRAWGNAFAR